MKERLITYNPCSGNSKLYGREKELAELRAIFEKATIPGESVQCVFVGGASGTGKSTLIEKAIPPSTLHGAGKFEKQAQAKPFAALIQCVGEVCKHHSTLHSNDEPLFKTILTEKLTQEELNTLIDVFPDVETLACCCPSSRQDSISSSTTSTPRSKEGLEKLKYALRLFLRAIATPSRPVILCLDDLHWMDSASLDLVDAIVSDTEMTNFVLVGSFRNKEASPQLLEWMKSAGSLTTNIMIGDLSLEYVEELLQDLLQLEQVHDLAQLIHKKTHGNIFHVLQLLDYMQSEELLEFSPLTFRWTYNINRLKEETSLSDNVVDIVSARLNRLSPQVLVCLKLCSCLSFRFDPNLLELIKDVLGENEIVDVKKCLETAIEAGILERLSENRIKFAHDRIHQAALRLFSNKQERNQVHLAIGMILWKEYGLEDSSVCETLEDRKLFACVDQLNMGRTLITDKKCMLDLARLNGEASKRAASFSAFVPSLQYLEVGIDLLDPESRWTDHYDLVLELYSSMAEMSFCAGRIEECQDASNEVLSHARSIDDSLRVYFVQTQSLTAQAKYSQLVDTALEILKKLGERVPPKPNSFYAKRMFDRTKKLLQSKTDEEILTLPMMTDKRKAAALQVMSESMMTLDQIGRFDLETLLTCRMVQLTFEYGIAPYSALAFAFTSQQLISSRNDIEAGVRFARLSVALLDKIGSNRTSAKVILYSQFAMHWREPLSITVDHWIDGYHKGMRHGDLNSAAQNTTGYSQAYFYSGLPLDPLVQDMENFCSLLASYGQKMTVLANVPVYQCILNLTGQSDSILDMSHGKAMDYRTKLGWEERTGEHAEWSFHMQIAFYCEDYALATTLAEKVEQINPGASGALPLYHARVFFFCLVAIHNAKETGKRQYRVKAKKYYNVVRGWVVKQRAINVVHKLQIVDAEMLTLEPKKRQTDEALSQAFSKAIAASTKAGFLQDAALAARLASRAIQEKELSREYFRKSCELYRSWGARGVADYLEQSARRRRTSFTGSTSGSSSSIRAGYRSRERFDKSVSLKHTKLDIEHANDG